MARVLEAMTKTLSDSEKSAVLNSPDFVLTSAAEYQGRVLKLYCKQVEHSGATNENYSELHWAIKVEGGVVNWYAAGPTTITFKEDVSTNALSWSKKWNRQGAKKIFPSCKNFVEYGCLKYSHHDSGTATQLKVSFETAIYWGAWNLKTSSNTWKMRKINRYFSTTPNLILKQDELTETFIRYDWSTPEPCDQLTIEVKGKTGEYGALSGYSITSGGLAGDVQIRNLLPGETYDITIKFRRKDSQVESTVKTMTTTYYYPYVEAITEEVLYPPEDDTYNTVQSFRIYNPLNREVTFYMGIKDGETEEGIIYQETRNWEWNEGEVNSYYSRLFEGSRLYPFLATSPSVDVYYFCKSHIETGEVGGADVLSHKSIKGKLAIVGTEVPDISPMTITWIDSSDAAQVTGQNVAASRNNWMVQNLSTLTVSIGNYAQGVAYATIKQYTVYFGKTVKTFLASEMPKTFNLDTFGINQNQKLKIKVEDSRGIIATTPEYTVQFKPYTEPSATIEAKRTNNYGPEVKTPFTYSYTSLDGKNGLKLYIKNSINQTKYIIGSSSSFGTTTSATSVTWDEQPNDSSVTYTIYVQDKFGDATAVGHAKVERGQPIFFIDEALLGVGVGCFPQGDGLYATRAKVDKFYIGDKLYIEYDATKNAIVFKSEG